MLHNKDKAIELRKSGLSYRAISKELSIPLPTLSLWFKGQEWSQKVGQSLAEVAAQNGALRLSQFKKARGFALQFSYARAKEDAANEFKKFRKDPLFFAGLMLYWAAGDQASPHYIKLRSTDSNKINLLNQFLIEYIKAPKNKIRYSLLLTRGQDSSETEGFWSKNAKIPLSGFTKSTFKRKPRSKTPVPSSVCCITYASRINKERMLVWLRLHAEELLDLGSVGQSSKKGK